MVRVCVFPFRSFESFSVNSFSVKLVLGKLVSCFCFRSAKLTSLASLDIASLAGTLTKLDITRCPKLLDVGVVSGLTMLVELGIYECPAVTGVLIVSELPRLTHLSIDLSRATRAHLGDKSVPLRRLFLSSYTPVDQSIWRYAYWVAEWLISDKDRAKVTVANRGLRGELVR